MKKRDKNTALLFVLAAIVGVMLGLVSQAEPLYKMFCGATGLGGTTQNVSVAPAQTKDRMITVSFDGNVDSALPWDFAPDQKSVRVKLGEVKTITFHARNNTRKTLVGWAVHNVQPDKAGLYFDKIQCFCMTNQILKPGQSAEFPVKFYIDPKIAEDRNEDDVTDITLSYTFYLAKDQSQAAVLKQARIGQ
jgi:cytochrome c oxidase assembly protein subunit 11